MRINDYYVVYKYNIIMKYYESSFEDYLQSVNKYNIHPELDKIINKFPTTIDKFNNTILYGPSGTGKYSQLIRLIHYFSPSKLKYESKLTATTDKTEYKYKISDIHYEIDMGLLGCNSKTLWSEIFSQIIDIISVKSNNVGIIVCKNFHLIHSELLEVFYSFMQHYKGLHSSIQVKFIIITEHLSFIPSKILNSCQIINITRPSKEKYYNIVKNPYNNIDLPIDNNNIIQRFSMNNSDIIGCSNHNIVSLINGIDTNGITNVKELKSFDLLYSQNGQVQDLPDDNFNIICNKIIEQIVIDKPIEYLNLRDNLYDILTYNLDVIECIWYIISYLITSQYLNCKDITDICKQSYLHLKYYNNNYRPIYHLESIFYYITIKVHNYDELL